MSIDSIYSFAQSILLQLAEIFGGFFVLGVILSELQKFTQLNYLKVLGWKGILWTAWIGTPVHEFGHIFFAKVFRHKIEKVSLFRPDKETGLLGEVKDSYSGLSFYQRVGNFFIGVGPIIFGSIVLAALLWIILPGGSALLKSLVAIRQISTAAIIDVIYSILGQIFSFQNMSHISFWLFFYLSFSIASHMAPSRVDLKRALSGLLPIVAGLVLFNLALLLFGADPMQYTRQISSYSNGLLALLVYAIVISAMHLIFSLLLLLVNRLWKMATV